MPFQSVKKKIQVFRQKMEIWNKREIGNLEDNIKKIEKEIDMRIFNGRSTRLPTGKKCSLIPKA